MQLTKFVFTVLDCNYLRLMWGVFQTKIELSYNVVPTGSSQKTNSDAFACASYYDSVSQGTC